MPTQKKNSELLNNNSWIHSRILYKFAAILSVNSSSNSKREYNSSNSKREYNSSNSKREYNSSNSKIGKRNQ